MTEESKQASDGSAAPRGEAAEVKPGYKTTEFWKCTVATLLSILFASGAIEETSGLGQVLGLVLTVLVAGGYSALRGFAKAKTKAGA